MKKLPLYLRIGMAVLGQNRNKKPNFDELLVDTELNPQKPTPENIDPVINLKLLIKLIEENYLSLDQVMEFNRERSEGYNHGISIAVNVIEKEIQRLQYKINLF